MTQEALKLALECAERCEAIDGMYSWSATIAAIKEALAQTQEPWCMKMNDCKTKCEDCPDEPPQRKPLTVQEIAKFVGTHEYGVEQLKWFRLGEAAHGIKE
jgi:hypothetical protein